MQVSITLTPEQLATLTSGVNTIEIGETHAKEIVNYLLTEQGEREQLAAQRADFEKQFAAKKAVTGNFTGMPLPYNWVDTQMNACVSLRKQVIIETAKLATKTILDDLKDHVAVVADQCTAEFKEKLPEILIRSYAAHSLCSIPKTSATSKRASACCNTENTMVKLEWTENRPPTEGACCYDHCIAETPFGRFLLTWKSWKENWDSLGFDETPWDGVEYHYWASIEEAKQWAADELEKRIRSLLVEEQPELKALQFPLPRPLPLLNLVETVREQVWLGQDAYGHEFAMIPPIVWRSVKNNVNKLDALYRPTVLPAENPQEQHSICDECETVAHCTENGCIPKQPQ